MKPKNTVFPHSRTLKCGDKLLNLSEPVVMGILNVTPDSFYDGGKYKNLDACLAHADQMIAEGAKIIDIGAVSTRPGAPEVTESEELQRLLPVLNELVKRYSRIIFSIDTFRSSVARATAACGANMINDISGGDLDENMFAVMAGLPASYVLMHMQGTPATMQVNPVYRDVAGEVFDSLQAKLQKLQEMGVGSVVIDPGFGFGKTIQHNYELLRNLHRFAELRCPVLVGVSRKSMIYKLLNISPNEALNGTSILNTLALLKGADILRVHDVKEAVETISIVNEYLKAGK
ncbi:MAG TPA: dihydropteroate synthase [Bacteroidales bacterium]|nr:dihydropteroate synthase [Bacteroidales bacterium]HPT01680.1 dihydropteroate synthase [Bacteroidales bacterium]